MPQVCLQFVIVEFPNHTHILLLVFFRVAVLHRFYFTLIDMAVSLLYLFFVTHRLVLQCVIFAISWSYSLIFLAGI